MPNIIQGPRCNRRVTCSSNPSNDRSESSLIIDPHDPYHLVAASKKFTDPHTYAFSLACCYSYDGGQSWKEAPALSLLPSNLVTSGPGRNNDWVGVSDPALAFDNLGNVFLLALPFGNNGPYDLRGMAVYKSTDGGQTWSAPNHIHNVLGGRQAVDRWGYKPDQSLLWPCVRRLGLGRDRRLSVMFCENNRQWDDMEKR